MNNDTGKNIALVALAGAVGYGIYSVIKKEYPPTDIRNIEILVVGVTWPTTDLRNINISVIGAEYPITDIMNIAISVTPGGIPSYPTTDIRNIILSVTPEGAPPVTEGMFRVWLVGEPFFYVEWLGEWEAEGIRYLTKWADYGGSVQVRSWLDDIPTPVSLTGKFSAWLWDGQSGHNAIKYGPSPEYALVDGGKYKFDCRDNKLYLL